jgi:hypothetical protein
LERQKKKRINKVIRTSTSIKVGGKARERFLPHFSVLKEKVSSNKPIPRELQRLAFKSRDLTLHATVTEKRKRN